MDFDKLIQDLLAQGATIEELGKQFIQELMADRNNAQY